MTTTKTPALELEWWERIVVVWCDARCTLSRGPICRCFCRGKFHGIGYRLPAPPGYETPADQP